MLAVARVEIGIGIGIGIESISYGRYTSSFSCPNPIVFDFDTDPDFDLDMVTRDYTEVSALVRPAVGNCKGRNSNIVLGSTMAFSGRLSRDTSVFLLFSSPEVWGCPPDIIPRADDITKRRSDLIDTA